LILVRHAESLANASGLIDSRPPGPGLSEPGYAQAAAFADRLAGAGIQGIRCSTALRTIETATPLAERLGFSLIPADDLVELDCGSLNGRADRGAWDEFRLLFQGWVSGDREQTFPEGESWADVEKRMLRALPAPGEIADGSAVAVVGHGVAFRIVIEALVGAAYAKEIGWMRNTGLVTLAGAPDGSWEMQSFDPGDRDPFDTVDHTLG
jgi:probable phosphoglycerate mutase